MPSPLLLDGSDEEAFDVVVAVVADGDDSPGGDGLLGPALHVHDLGGLESGLELTDAGLHLPLAVLRRVVVAVLRQVSEGPRRLDRSRDLDASTGRQVLELSLQALVGGRCELS